MLQSFAITAGTDTTHLLVVLGIAAVDAGHKVRYFTAAELIETLYRALADNSVGRVIENPLRNDLVLVDELGFAPLRLGSEASFAALCGTALSRQRRADQAVSALPRWRPGREPEASCVRANRSSALTIDNATANYCRCGY